MQWLFLVHQVRTPNSRERVKVWRLTKKVGALLYRNSVYVLPHGKERLEDFQWLCQQIRDSRGEASVFVSEAKDAAEDTSLRQQFVDARGAEYLKLLKRIDGFARQYERPGSRPPFTAAQLKNVTRQLRQMEGSFHDIRRIDFFDHPFGRRIDAALHRLRSAVSTLEVPTRAPQIPLKHRARSEFRGRLWATRPHIHIDRLCSAWLIRRFIDPKPRFVFAPEGKLPKKAIPFDVFGAEFSHQEDRCTFETLLEVFRLRDKALSFLAELVHEIDLKDDKYNRPESAGLDLIVRSLSDSLLDDAKTLEVGSQILDALYERLTHTGRP